MAGKIKAFLDSKLVKKDVGEETVLTWGETMSYALGRGAQGMNTSMTASKYVNYYLTNVLLKNLSNPTATVSQIRLYCGIFDAINDPIMGVIVDKTRTKNGQMRPYIKWAPIFVSIVMVLFFIGSSDTPNVLNVIYATVLFVLLDVSYTAFDIPMGALAFSITPSAVERTKLFGVSSITRSICAAVPTVFVAASALLPYFKDHTPEAYRTAAIIAGVFIIILTRITYRNVVERAHHSSDTPSLKECVKLLLHNKPLLLLFIGNLIYILCKVPEQVSYYFVADLMYNRSYNVFVDVVKFPGTFLAGIIVPVIVEKLGAKSDSKRFYQVCCLAGIVINALFGLCTYDGLVNKEDGTSVSLFLGIVILFFTMLQSFPYEFKNLIQKEMEAETVDYIEYHSGVRAEGTMLSIMSFTGKIENSFSSSIALGVLGITGYEAHDEGSLVQNRQTNIALWALTTVVCIVGWLFMLIPIHFYSITGDEHRMMMAEIQKRRAAAEAAEAAEAGDDAEESVIEAESEQQ